MLSPADIAKVAHDANRSLCQALGDDSQPEWEAAPAWQRLSAVHGVNFHIEHHNQHGRAPSPSASHESWLAVKQADGWVYGPVKDPEKKEHPCFLPYSQLPVAQRLKDYLFSGVVAAFINCGEAERQNG